MCALPIHPSIHPSIYSFIHPSIHLPTLPYFLHPSTYSRSHHPSSLIPHPSSPTPTPNPASTTNCATHHPSPPASLPLSRSGLVRFVGLLGRQAVGQSVSRSVGQSVTHSRTHSLTHSLIHALTHSRTHALTHSLTPQSRLLPLTHLTPPITPLPHTPFPTTKVD